MKTWRAPLGLAIGVAVGFALVRTEVGLPGVPYFQFFPPVAIAILALVCFRDLARRDRIAFVSIIGPAMGVALVSVALPGILNPAVALLAVGFTSLFVFTNWFSRWWWRHILRRR